jgi:SHS2 domain-containing protein
LVVRFLNHTADVGFALEAESLEGLFQGALEGLLRLMFQNPPQRGRRRRRVVLEAEDLETLLVRYLNELVYLIQTKGFVPAKARVRIFPKEGGFRLEATLLGEPSREAFGFQGEVKSATYHGLSVVQERGLWKAQVILDV